MLAPMVLRLFLTYHQKFIIQKNIVCFVIVFFGYLFNFDKFLQ